MHLDILQTPLSRTTGRNHQISLTFKVQFSRSQAMQVVGFPLTRSKSTVLNHNNVICSLLSKGSAFIICRNRTHRYFFTWTLAGNSLHATCCWIRSSASHAHDSRQHQISDTMKILQTEQPQAVAWQVCQRRDVTRSGLSCTHVA